MASDFLSEDEIEKLYKKAEEVLENAYAPYSNISVSAAILTQDNEIHTGVNVENSSYGLTICAERAAVFKAVTAGQKDLKAICIVTDSTLVKSPCGACRQVLAEFNPDLPVYFKNPEMELKTTIKDLLPSAFLL